jgi:hypothetical protein
LSKREESGNSRNREIEVEIPQESSRLQAEECQLVAIGAYTSLIGLVKYARMYGLYSDIAAELGNCQETYELQ